MVSPPSHPRWQSPIRPFPTKVSPPSLIQDGKYPNDHSQFTSTPPPPRWQASIHPFPTMVILSHPRGWAPKQHFGKPYFDKQFGDNSTIHPAVNLMMYSALPVWQPAEKPLTKVCPFRLSHSIAYRDTIQKLFVSHCEL